MVELTVWSILEHRMQLGLRGATVARLTPDQKVACSNHVGVNLFPNNWPNRIHHETILKHQPVSSSKFTLIL